MTAQMDAYAVVFYEAQLPVATIMFPARELGRIGRDLGKRHPNPETILQLTRVNYQRLMNETAQFRVLGVRSWRAPSWHEGT